MWTPNFNLILHLSVTTTAQTYLTMRVVKAFSSVSISLVRYSVLILNKVEMTNLNVDYTVDSIYLHSYGSSFNPTLDAPPDYNALSPFASNGGY